MNGRVARALRKLKRAEIVEHTEPQGVPAPKPRGYRSSGSQGLRQEVADRPGGRIFRGIMAPSAIVAAADVGNYRLRRHNDPDDSFTLGNHRHPQARRMMREQRNAQAEAAAAFRASGAEIPRDETFPLAKPRRSRRRADG